MMTNARWPNAKWSDKSIFNGDNWAHVNDDKKKGESKRAMDNKINKEIGVIFNKGDSLKDTKIDMAGAMAVMNIGSFLTFVAKVESHDNNKFTFIDTFGNYDFKPKNSYYFMEDKLDLLDSAEEWVFEKDTDAESGTLYLWTKDGDSPDTEDPITKEKKYTVRGKDQTYAFEITDSSHLVLKNLIFFGTTLKAESTSTKKNDQLRFDSLQFKFPSYSKRMLGDASLIENMKIGTTTKKRNKKNKETKFYEEDIGHYTFYNNTFYGSDGYLAFLNGNETTFENNVFSYNDWTGAHSITQFGGAGIFLSWSKHDKYIRNTLDHNGAHTGLQPGSNVVVKLNQFIGQCWGVIQHDGAGVQVSIFQ